MRVRKMLALSKDDASLTTRIEHFCNEARNFFTDEGSRAVGVLFNGHDVSIDHVRAARVEVQMAIHRIQETESHPIFPSELKSQYLTNLCWVASIMMAFEGMLAGGDEINSTAFLD